MNILQDEGKDKATLATLPWEIKDLILVKVGNEKLAVVLERFSIVRQINPLADFNWAIRERRLKYLQYFL